MPRRASPINTSRVGIVIFSASQHKRAVFPPAKVVFSDWQMLLAFGLGSGLSRIVPGTVGTLAAVPFYLLMAQGPLWLYALITLVACVAGIAFCEHASRKLKVHDHSGIVWDEFAGYWIAMFALPLTWQWTLAGFVVFRLFDMIKPWPISILDRRVHGGFGIMVDDIAAGLASALTLHAMYWYLS